MGFAIIIFIIIILIVIIVNIYIYIYTFLFFINVSGEITPKPQALPGLGLQGHLFSSDACIVNPKKLETGLRTNSAGIPYTLLLRIEAIGFPTFGLLL